MGAGLALLVAALFLPKEVLAHAKGLYPNQAEAEKRALELGCKGTHQNGGLWMPCANEQELHKALRHE